MKDFSWFQYINMCFRLISYSHYFQNQRYRLKVGLFPAIRLSQFPMNTNPSSRCPIELQGSGSESGPSTNDSSGTQNYFFHCWPPFRLYQYVPIIRNLFRNVSGISINHSEIVPGGKIYISTDKSAFEVFWTRSIIPSRSVGIIHKTLHSLHSNYC